MNDQPYLVTTRTFKNKDYLVKMKVINASSLDLCVTDKYTAEDWQCTYDAAYIENLTHKTGNFKQFDIFITMLKSGLLKTSESITLDLLTYDDFELLRNHCVNGRNFCTPRTGQSNHLITNANCRFLILTYTVEFDKINYPLPMDYCGPPDPKVLQTQIRRLEGEVARLQEQIQRSNGHKQVENNLQIAHMEKRIEDLMQENRTLTQEVQYLNKAAAKRTVSNRELVVLQNTVRTLEENVVHERSNFEKVIRRLREDKVKLMKQVEELTTSERGMRSRLQQTLRNTGNGSRPGTIHRLGEDQLISSYRYPGDGLGSAGLKMEQLTSKTRSPSPTWQSKLHVQDKSLRTRSTIEPRHQSAECRKCYQRRSSSESSVGNRKHAAAQCNRIPLNKLQAAANTRFGDDNLHKQKVFQRGRPRERTTGNSVVRSASENSPCSATGRIKTTRRSGGSRHSSACSSASCCRRSDGSEYQYMASPKKQRRHKKNEGLKHGMTDLERRIQALQKVLREGLSMK